MHRRDFLGRLAGGSLVLATGCAGRPGAAPRAPQRLFFTSAGKTCLIHADGTGFRTLEFDVPNQATWQPGPFLSDGRRVLFLSMEPRRDGPGRPFEEYYTQTPTHLWIHDLDRGTLEEVATRERRAPFYTPQALVDDHRILVQVVRGKVGQVVSMNLDGSDARDFTKPGEGLPYGFSVSPDRRRVAFHLASPQGYQIWTSDAEGGDRVLVRSHPDHLYFGPTWSPDGQWLLFQDCLFKADPGHDASDICVARPDGSGFRVATKGQEQWFAATYGNPTRRGGGSNMPTWTHDGKILFSRKSPGARVPWEYAANRPDTDHFNRDWKPESARGAATVCRLDPRDGSIEPLTHRVPPEWECRAAESPDGRRVAFCRNGVGEMPSLWAMDADGGGERLLSRGIDGAGADHPRWLPGR